MTRLESRAFYFTLGFLLGALFILRLPRMRIAVNKDTGALVRVVERRVS